jgi:hypothetical protein
METEQAVLFQGMAPAMKCYICDWPISTNKELREHLLSRHETVPAQYFERYPRAEKICSKCGKALANTEFQRDKTHLFGYRSQCIECLNPGSSKRECPCCARKFLWSAIVRHMKKTHGVSTTDVYYVYLKEKYCPRCKQVKQLDAFSRMKDKEHVFFSYCRDCNRARYRPRSPKRGTP